MFRFQDDPKVAHRVSQEASEQKASVSERLLLLSCGATRLARVIHDGCGASGMALHSLTLEGWLRVCEGRFVIPAFRLLAGFILDSRFCHVERASQKDLAEMKMAALQCFWPVWQDAPADYLSRLYRTVNQFIEAAENFTVSAGSRLAFWYGSRPAFPASFFMCPVLSCE